MPRLKGAARVAARDRAGALKYGRSLTCKQVAAEMGLSFAQVKHLLKDWRVVHEGSKPEPHMSAESAGENTRDTSARPSAESPEGAGWHLFERIAHDMASIEENDERFDEMFDLVERLNVLMENEDPKLTHIEMEIEGDGPAAIMFTSCAHLGGRYTDHEEFRSLVKRALGIERLYWAPLGDDIEGYIPTFRARKTVMEQTLSIPQQLMMSGIVLSKLALAGRLLLGMASQHGGDWFEKSYGYNPVKELYRGVKRPWFDGQAYIKLRVGQQVYNIAAAHEFPGYSMYNQLHPHARAHKFNFPNADVIVQGDKHVYAMEEATSYVWEADAGNRASPFVYFVQTGTAKTGADPYTVKRWSHGIFEWPILIFDDKIHQIEGTRHLRTVRGWLNGAEHGDVRWRATGTSEGVKPWGVRDVPAAFKSKAIRDAEYSGSGGVK